MLTTIRYPLRVPLKASLGGLWFRDVTLVGGPAGWGEFSPVPGYPVDVDRCWAAATEAAEAGWPAPVRDSVAVNGIVLAIDPDEAAEAALAWTSGQRPGTVATVKIKVGDDSDVDRVAAVRSAVGPRARLRVDANGAWDIHTAVTRIAQMAPYGLELVEQPVAGIEDMAQLRRRMTVPLAADECVRNLHDAQLLAALNAADVLVLKVQPLGGVRTALTIAESAGVPAIVTSMFETSVGLAAGLALAGALPELPYACGLGSANLLAVDVVAESLLARDGWLKIRPVEPDPEKMLELARSVLPLEGLG